MQCPQTVGKFRLEYKRPQTMLPKTCHHSSILTRMEARKNNYINGSKYITGDGTIQLGNSTTICTSITKNHYFINRPLMRTLKHAHPMHDAFINLIEDAP